MLIRICPKTWFSKLPFCFLLFFCASVFSSLKDPNVHAVTEGDLTNNLCDCVNLLTGDFVAFSQDLKIDGAEPLYLKRSYISGDGKGENGGWTFFPHLKLKLIPSKINKEGKGKDFRRIVVAEPSGAKLIYKRQPPVKKQWPTYRVDFEKHGKGITNISHGHISGRTNLKNNVLYLTSDSTIKLVTADGSERSYEKIKEKAISPRYLLKEEKLLSGNRIIYSYDTFDRLKQVHTTNAQGSKIYTYFCIHYKDSPAKQRDFSVETSDGRWLHYKFLKKGQDSPRFFLQSIEGPELPPEVDEYIRPHHFVQRLVHQRSLPDGRRIKADYYIPNTINDVRQDIHIKVSDEEDPRSDRVKILYMPVGKGSELIPTHRFIYGISRKKIKRKKYVYEENGLTEVLDAYGNKSSVQFTSHFYPTQVRYFDEKGLHHFVQMHWQNNGELKEKILLDQNGQRHISRELVYDERGNVIHEKQRGNFTGNHSDEIISTYYQYDERNLLLRQEEDSGLIILYAYLPGTDLLSSKFFLNKERIFKREFYQYNEDHIITCSIVDDGICKEVTDLTGVTERKIQKIFLKNSQPALNLPEIIEERALDLKSGNEILLKKIRIHYSAQAHVIQKDVYDQEGNFCYSLKTDYDERSRPIKENDPVGNIAKCSYDIHGNKIEEVSGNGKRVFRSYDSANRLIFQEEKTPDGESRKTSYEYDYKNNKTLEVDPFGNATRYSYDAFGNLTKIIHPNQSTQQFAYDNFGRKVLTVDPLNRRTQTSYNALGKPLEIIYPDGNRESYRYTIDGKLEQYTNQEGMTIKYSYDLLGRETAKIFYDVKGEKIAEETFTFNTFHLLEKKDKNGTITRYAYDFAGRKIAEECEDEKTEFEYDSLGRIGKERKINGINTLVLIFKRDFLDRVLEERREDLQGSVLQLIQYDYDSAGNRTSIATQVQGKLCQEVFSYDGFNRLISLQDPNGSKNIIAYDEEHLNEQEQKVLRKITRDPLGMSTIETFDVCLHLVEKKQITPQGFICSSEEWRYDPAGNCILHNSYIYQGTSYLRTFTIEKAYDDMNRLISLTEERDKVTHFSYTPLGHLKQMQKPDGILLHYDYDSLGHLISLVSSDHTVQYFYSYDLEGNLIYSRDCISSASTKRTLDAHGRILEEILPNELALHYTYDHLGRKTELHIPNNTKISYSYDALFLRKIEALNQECHFDYDQGGNLITQSLPGSLGIISYDYDLCGRRTGLTSTFFKQKLFYDPLGNVIQMDIEKERRDFSYDSLQQITQENSLFSHEYIYDSGHNRLAKDNEICQINDHNQLITSGQISYTYDLNGNPISKKTPTSVINYKYDALDRLVEIVEENIQKILFTYDSLHRRINKTCYSYRRGAWEKKSHQNYLYDGFVEIASYDDRRKRLQLRLLGEGERQAALFELAGYLYAPIQDLQGNVIKLIALDNPGKIFSYNYNAFGEETSEDLFNPWRYASKRLDFETGLIFFGRRYYDPQTGRWLTPDPMGYTDSSNLYQYALNNPLANIDLFGLSVNDLENSWYSASNPPPGVTFRAFENDYFITCEQYKKSKTPEDTSFLIVPQIFEKSKIYYYKDESSTIMEDPKKKIMLVNGIYNSSEDALKHTAYISAFGGGYPVTLIHNASHALGNFVKAKISLNNIATETTMLIVEELKRYFENAPQDATCLIITHSAGGPHMRTALHFVPKDCRDRIFVLTFASPGYVNSDLCAYIKHYVSGLDLVHRLFDHNGARLYANTIEVLKAHQNASFPDHEIISPTYKKPLKTRINEYLSTGILR